MSFLLLTLLWGDVKVQDMMMLMRHMLLEGHLAEKRDTKNPIRTGSQTPSCSALLKVRPPVRSARFIDANLYAASSPLIIVGETKTNWDWQPGSVNDTMHLVKQHPPLHKASMYNLHLPMCITSFTSLYLAPFYLHTTFSQLKKQLT